MLSTVDRSESQACIFRPYCNEYGGAYTRHAIIAAIQAPSLSVALQCALACADQMISNGDIVGMLSAK